MEVFVLAQKKKKKIVKVDGYWRTSYGKRHFVKKHTRGHQQSIRLPDKPGYYRAGDRIHKYSPGKDLARFAPNRRGKKEARWRGDFLRERL